jgi:CheY-like chemotaxis protein
VKLETLIVDDDDMVVFLHKMAIAQSGLSQRPAVAFNGGQALDYISQQQTPDTSFLVLLDINMPVMDGWEFLDTIQTFNLLAPIYIVMVTSSVDNRDRKKAKTYTQVIDYVEKPLSVDTCIHIKKLPQVARLID